MADVDCPRAKTWMTPCIARDGSLALADDHTCVGCTANPNDLLRDLADRFPKAGDYRRTANKDAAADALRDYVSEYVRQP